MTRKLSFLLMGAPRSGTTAVTEAINCHPLVFCGIEVFLPLDRHTNIKFPHSFQQRLALDANENYRAVRCLLDLKSEATIIGNKHPRYDLRLRELTQASPWLKLVFIYRSPREFVNSWNRRAADVADVSWHPGQRGMFGFLSLFNYLSALRHIKADCLIVPYGAFCRDVVGTTNRIIRHLGVTEPMLSANQAAIEELQRAANSLRNNVREERSNESEFFHAAKLQDLDSIFARDSTILFLEIRGKVDAYLQSIRGLWGQAFLEGLVSYDDPLTIQYFRKMLHYRTMAEIFAEEAARSPQLKRHLRSLPRGMKLRRIFLRRKDLAPFERFIHRVQAASAQNA